MDPPISAWLCSDFCIDCRGFCGPLHPGPEAHCALGLFYLPSIAALQVEGDIAKFFWGEGGEGALRTNGRLENARVSL